MCKHLRQIDIAYICTSLFSPVLHCKKLCSEVSSVCCKNAGLRWSQARCNYYIIELSTHLHELGRMLDQVVSFMFSEQLQSQAWPKENLI